MESILQKQVSNVMSQFPDVFTSSTYSMHQEILSPDDIEITKELINDSHAEPFLVQLLEKFLKSHEIFLYENSFLASRMILEAGAKRIYQHNPGWIKNFTATGGDFSSAFQKKLLLQRELMQHQLDHEGMRAEQLEKTI